MTQKTPLMTWLRRNDMLARDLAKQIGITPEHLSRICSGAAKIQRQTALAIERATDGGVTVKDWGLE